MTTTVPGAGLEVEVYLIPIERGIGATVEYHVIVWQVSGDYRKPIQGGEQLLPPAIINEAKLKLWGSIKP